MQHLFKKGRMKYKEYTAHIEIDETAEILFGKVLDVKDVITFQGNTVAELEQEFHNSVDNYLEWCAELGKKQTNLSDFCQ